MFQFEHKNTVDGFMYGYVPSYDNTLYATRIIISSTIRKSLIFMNSLYQKRAIAGIK